MGNFRHDLALQKLFVIASSVTSHVRGTGEIRRDDKRIDTHRHSSAQILAHIGRNRTCAGNRIFPRHTAFFTWAGKHFGKGISRTVCQTFLGFPGPRRTDKAWYRRFWLSRRIHNGYGAPDSTRARGIRRVDLGHPSSAQTVMKHDSKIIKQGGV